MGGIPYESLERRCMLSGNVESTFADGLLQLRGDALPNSIIVRRGNDVSAIIVEGISGTTIDGENGPVVLANPGRLLIDLAAGEDSICFENARFGGSVFVRTGKSSDTVFARNMRVAGDFELDTSGGRDRVELRDLHVRGHFHFDGGGEQDRFDLRRSRIGETSNITGGAGRDWFHMGMTVARAGLQFIDRSGPTRARLYQFTTDGDAVISTGNSIDALNIQRSTFNGRTTIALGDHDDSAYVRSTIFAQPMPIFDGRGEDQINREVILSWDFNDGEQGWEAGFGDYSPSNATASGETPEEFYGMESGVAHFEIAIGRQFLLAGSNRSDDLLMFVTARLDKWAGIVASEEYLATYSVGFFSNVPAGLDGAGGAPAESVWVKVGGAPIPLQLIAGSEGNVRLNIDVGNQAEGGANASVAGNIANGLSLSDPDGGRSYALVELDHQHPVAIPANQDGQVWLFMGYDSGFQGETRIYIQSINLSLIPASR